MSKRKNIFQSFVASLLAFWSVFMAVSCGEASNEQGNEKTIAFVENGKSEYVIVIPESTSEAVSYAAQELQSFVEEATGAELPIKTETEEVGEKFFSIGKTQLLETASFAHDYSLLNYDGFYLETKNDCFYVDALNDRGFMYGVYEFLEVNLGIRFVAEDYTYIPEQTTVVVKECNYYQAPEFRLRNYFSGAGYNGDSAFFARTRMYAGEERSVAGYGNLWYENEIGNVGHNSMDYVRKADWLETHPEFYASYTNTALSKDSVHDDICYTNGVTKEGELDENMDVSVAKITLEKLKQYAMEDEQAEFFFIGIADHMGGGCYCENCRKIAEEADGKRSGPVVMFINLMARELEKWGATAYPGREFNLAFFAYFWTEMPPVKYENGVPKAADSRFVLEDNVYVRYAPLQANFAYGIMDARQVTAKRESLKAWASISQNMMIWDYNCDFHDYSRYFPDLNYFADNLKYYKSIGVKYMMNQSSWTSRTDWQGKMKYYIASKLYWDVNANVGEIMAEFLKLYYGVASEEMLQFIEVMENHFAYLRNTIAGFEIQCTAGTQDYHGYESFPILLLETCQQILSRGEADIQASQLSEEQKIKLKARLAAVKLTPLGMILRQYENYYADGEMKPVLAKEYADCVTLSGTVAMGEGLTITSYLAKYGFYN